MLRYSFALPRFFRLFFLSSGFSSFSSLPLLPTAGPTAYKDDRNRVRIRIRIRIRIRNEIDSGIQVRAKSSSYSSSHNSRYDSRYNNSRYDSRYNRNNSSIRTYLRPYCTRPEGLGGSRDAGSAMADPRPPYVTEAEKHNNVGGGYGYGTATLYSGHGRTGRTGRTKEGT
ncbi:hypothetical protein L249_5152 [Ophiocordyceps polyrhachis-furcata BCC 54312]|uniref:Uncharacterized protein n=1 Tax=Ophiocordyceps polyrhachis-furcata BCC 54312 TaxID=1330021 RepID=A0A367L3B6_9HYPO|nr:hypothetical protein L249_5152 [Ophiocordyceps polyrhachis-furcata BCC 54312]